MKKTLIILTATLFFTITTKGQNLFFIGENSYPCTETVTLKSNSDSANNLDVLLAKDGTTVLFVVSVQTRIETFISGKLFIYLDDGTVITCIDRQKYDYVDNIASVVYSLTNEQLGKMKNSNINTVRYTLGDGVIMRSFEEGNYSASNKGRATKTDFPTLITEFFY